MPQVQVLSPRPAASRRRQVAHSLLWVRFTFIARAEEVSFLSVDYTSLKLDTISRTYIVRDFFISPAYMRCIFFSMQFAFTGKRNSFAMKYNYINMKYACWHRANFISLYGKTQNFINRQDYFISFAIFH